MSEHPVSGSPLDLVDFRHHVADGYARWRAAGAGEDAWWAWRVQRDELFSLHSQSPIPATERERFSGLPFFDYDPSWRLVGHLEALPQEPWGDFVLVGRLWFDREGIEMSLNAYWLDTYGGGLFVPFGDATNGSATYGGGRYLIDSVKGAYLGRDGSGVIMDFNGAYHPSCVHDEQWTCPLPSPENRLSIRVEAGERL